MKVKTLLIGIMLVSTMIGFGQHSPADSTNTTTDLAQVTGVQIYAPNAFTPDGDYYNDSWKVFMDGIDIYDFHLMVYDRSGQMVWESYDSSAEWDGSFNGDVVQSGMYVWVIETSDANTDQRFQFDGFIAVLN